LCARRILSALSLLVALQPLHSAPVSAFAESRRVTFPPDLVDASIDGSGDIYLLLRGMPHLVVLRADGSSEEYDLREITVPGGLHLDQGWGWYATGELSGTLYRYDRNGVMTGSWDAPGLPGDVCVAGLSVLYVSRTDGTVRSVRDPEEELLGLEGSGDGQLTPMGRRFVYSSPDESMVLDEYNSPLPLPASGIWTAAGEELVLLTDSCVCTREGLELFRLPPGETFGRISLAGGGAFCLLWSPGEEKALVLR